MSTGEPVSAPSLLADLESRQDELLRLLADLEARTETALAQLGIQVGNAAAAPGSNAAAPASQPTTPATDAPPPTSRRKAA